MFATSYPSGHYKQGRKRELEEGRNERSGLRACGAGAKCADLACRSSQSLTQHVHTPIYVYINLLGLSKFYFYIQ